jgi:hypothetical protein
MTRSLVYCKLYTLCFQSFIFSHILLIDFNYTDYIFLFYLLLYIVIEAGNKPRAQKS